MTQFIRLATIASCSVLVAGSVFAQEVESDDGSDQVAILDSITVTAQRREQSLQDVPLSVTAITGDSLQAVGTFDTASLQDNVAGLTFTDTAGIGIPVIRGVGSSNIGMGSESSVATYVDGVYRPFRAGGIFALNNIDRVEVLRGPQGALFGRNATGGVLQIITRTPSTTPSLDLSAGIASYDRYTGNLYATTGLSDNLAIDLAVYRSDQKEGWGRDLARGEDAYFGEETSVRSKLLWTPSDRTSVTLAADYNYRLQDIPYRLFPGSIAFDGSVAPTNFYDVRTSEPNVSENEQSGASLTVEHDLGWGDLKSITAFQKIESLISPDNDATGLPILTAGVYGTGEAWTQEFQIASPSESRIGWLFGGFLMDADVGNDPTIVSGAALAAIGFRRTTGIQNTSSFAVFGQLTYPLTENLDLTGGLRYSRDEQDLEFRQTTGLGPGASGSQSESFENVSPRLVLEYRPTSDVMIYGSYNKGFKSGAYNVGSPTANPVRPEVLTAYEVGLKSELNNGRVRLNGSTYFYDYEDLQVLIIEVTTSLQNAAAVEIYGLDADVAVAVTDRLTLRGSVALINGEYQDFENAPITSSNAPFPGSTTVAGDASGNETARTPSYQFILGGTYALTDNLTLHANYTNTDSYFWEPDNRLEADGRQMLSASLDWHSSDDRWSASLWGKNLFDEEYNTLGTAITFGDLAQAGEPLTVGATIGVHF